MLVKIYAFLALTCAIAVIGALEAGMYLTAAALIAGTGISAYLTMREDGRIRHKNRSHRRQANETYE